MKNKRDIYKSMATNLGYSNERTKEAVEYIFDKISEFLAEGEKVQLLALGILKFVNVQNEKVAIHRQAKL